MHAVYELGLGNMHRRGRGVRLLLTATKHLGPGASSRRKTRDASPARAAMPDVSFQGAACERLNCCWLPQMVFSSSCTVYGNPTRVPIDEEHPLAAVSPYGRTKLIIEDIFRDYSAADSQWRTILLRYFNPVGAHPSGPPLYPPATTAT